MPFSQNPVSSNMTTAISFSRQNDPGSLARTNFIVVLVLVLELRSLSAGILLQFLLKECHYNNLSLDSLHRKGSYSVIRLWSQGGALSKF